MFVSNLKAAVDLAESRLQNVHLLTEQIASHVQPIVKVTSAWSEPLGGEGPGGEGRHFPQTTARSSAQFVFLHPGLQAQNQADLSQTSFDDLHVSAR